MGVYEDGSSRGGTKRTFVSVILKKLTRAAYDRMYNRMRGIAGQWYSFIEAKMNEPKHGIDYYNPATGRMYTASAPGEYAAKKTGNLLAMLRIFVGSKNYNANFMRINCTSGAYYSSFLEVEMGRKLIEASKEDFFEIARKELEKG